MGDSCGSVIDCGGCSAPQTCGGGGLANVCGCSPPGCPGTVFCGNVQIDDSNPCRKGVCDPATTVITYTAVANGTPCSDDNACNGLERCFGGVCVGGVAPIVDDGDPCTIDTCYSDAGPVHQTVSGCTKTPGSACFANQEGAVLSAEADFNASVQSQSDAAIAKLKAACPSCAAVLK